MKKRERLLNLIDWHPVRISDHLNTSKRSQNPLPHSEEHKKNSIESQKNRENVRFEDHKHYSVEEIIKEYDKFMQEQTIL